FGAQTAADFLVNLPASGTGVSIPGTTAGLLIGRFLGTTSKLDLRLSAGEALAQTKLVSAPKIITLVSKPAQLEQVRTVPVATHSTVNTTGLPMFNLILFCGELFKNEGVSVNQTELLVFITPIIIKE